MRNLSAAVTINSMKMLHYSVIAIISLLLNGGIVPDCFAAEESTPVSIVKAVIAPVYEEIPLTGSVTARHISRLSPKVDGFISEVLVDSGDEVAKGDPLLRLDPVMAKIELARVLAQVNEAKARFKEAGRQRNEAAELVKKKHIPATNYEAAVAEVDINEAVLQRLQSEYRRQQEILDRHTVFAPFDGIITEKLIETGEWVEAGTALFDLAEIEVLRINVPVPQYYYSHIDVGSQVNIKFDANPDRIFKGKVTLKVPMGNVSTRTFPVRIDIKNEDRVIAPGMSARVYIQLQQAQTGQAMLLPRDAIIKKPDGTELVWVIDEQNGISKAESVIVQTGRIYKDNVEIVAGKLEVGDKVVIRGNEILQPGQQVKVKEVFEVQL